VKTKEFIAIEVRLLPFFPDFVIKGPMMFFRPLADVLRGFHFEPSAFSKNDFYVSAFFIPLYVPTSHVHFTFGHRIEQEHRGWKLDQPNIEAALNSEMRKELPFLMSLERPAEVVNALLPMTAPNELGHVNPHCCEALAYALVESKRENEAVEVLDGLLKSTDREVLWQNEIAERASLIRERLAEGSESAREQLAHWKSETIRNLDLGDSM